MKQEIRSSVESGQPARRKGRRWWPPPKKLPPIGSFHKLGLSVRGFLEAAVGPGGDGGGGPSSSSSGPLQQPACLNGRRNRREMRRENRKLKRGRRKRLLMVNGAAKSPLPSRAVSVRKRKLPPPPPVEEEREEEEEEEEKPAEVQPRVQQPRTAPSATAAATRKRALLAANEAEEREIRRLERQLGLHKRRKKQRAGGGQEGEAAEASLPQSFSRDGLDYVLGALSEAASSGLYETGTEAEGEGSGAEGGLSPVEDGEDEPGSSVDCSGEEGSDSESGEGESSQEAAGLAGGFSVFKSASLNVAMAEKQDCQARRRPEVKWYNGC